MEDKIPSTINNCWQVLKELGHGGMGQVLLGQAKDGSLVAIKLLDKIWMEKNKGAVGGFKSEFSILKELSHPGINRIYDFGFDENIGQYFFTTEFIDGEHFLAATKNYTVDEIEKYFVEILRALEYLHARGIIHGDIKSANILIPHQKDESGIKLIDFGLAALGSLKKVVGTPSYIAPEVILKSSPDNRADLYSLGVLMYTALTGQNPFKGKTMDQTFNRQLNLTADAPSLHRKGIPHYLDDIILKLLKKLPCERFAQASHIIRAINAKSEKFYPVETKATFLSYLPTEGNLVGRDKELNRIKDICIAVKNGEKNVPSILCVTGRQGTGKKRLLSELKYFAQLNEMNVVELKDVEKKQFENFNEEINRILEGPSKPTLATCHITGLVATRTEALYTIETIRRLVKYLSLSQSLSGVVDRPRIIFAFAALPEEIPLLKHVLDLKYPHATISLKNLSKEQTTEFLRTLTGISDVSDKLTSEIFSRTQGNPYFITEYVKELANNKLLFDEQGRWNCNTIEDIGINFDQFQVPSSLADILSKAFLSLLAEEKTVLKSLAIWNRPATQDEIDVVAKTTNITKILQSLYRQGLILFSSTDGTYSFRNTLFREEVYRELDLQQKAKLHLAAKQYLKDTKPELQDEILWHSGRGDEPHSAIDSLLELGMYRIKNRHPLESISAFAEAELVARKDGYRLKESLLHHGEACVLSRQYQDAIKLYTQLEGQKTEEEEHSIVLEKLGIAHLRNGSLEKAKETLIKADATLQIQPGGNVPKIKIDNYLARIAFLEGRLDEAKAIYERTKTQWKLLPSETKPLVTNNDLAHVYFQQGRLDLALAEFEENIAFYKTIKEENELKRSYYAMAEIFRIKNETDKAIETINLAIDIAKRLSDTELLLRAYNSLGNISLAKYEYDLAVKWYERGLELAARIGEETMAAAISVNLGLVELQRDKIDDARMLFESTVAILERSTKKTPLDINYQFRAHVEMANIFVNKMDFDAASHQINIANKIIAPHNLSDDQKALLNNLQKNFDTKRITAPCDKQSTQKTKSESIKQSKGKDVTCHEDHFLLDIHIDKQTEAPEMETKYYQYILEINKFLGGEPEPDFVLRTILKYAIELSGAQSGIVLLNGDSGLEIKCATGITLSDGLKQISISIAKNAMEQDKIIITENAITDDRFDIAKSVMELELKSVICVPIHIRKKVEGVIYLENRSKAGIFKNEISDILSAFADQAGIAIENARLLKIHISEEKRLKDELDLSFQKIEKLDIQLKNQPLNLGSGYKFHKMTSLSPKMGIVFDVLTKISDTDLATCVSGESGTGKELVAKAIHLGSGRAGKPFVAINCAAIPPALIESELFGYKMGAFTGATKDKLGLVEAAEGGTLFLDEITELDVSLQSKLLRVLEEKEIQRLGDTKTIRCDIRIVCATNRDLNALVAAEKFRKDLFYRIAEIKIDLPPLRERIEDIPLLIEEFANDYYEKMEIKQKFSIDKEFIRACMSYEWPGNIREMENAVRVAAALADEGLITITSLPDNHVLKRFTQQEKQTTGIPRANIHKKPIDSFNEYNPARTWREYESLIIASAYKANSFSVKDTARSLGLSVPTIYKKVAELKLKDNANSLYAALFQYDKALTMENYLANIFQAAFEHASKHPYHAAKLLKVSSGFFYRVIKKQPKPF